MAPGPLGEISPLKRTAEATDFDDFGPLKVKRPYHHHHRPHWRQEIDVPEPFCDDQETIDGQLRRALALALHSVGFEYAEPDALESMRQEAEQYMAHFLASVRQSMLASRRTQPIPHDFLYALTSHQLSLTSLLPHLDPPVEHSQTQSLLQIAPQSFPDTRAEEAVIAKLLHEPIATATATVAPMPLPRTFPALPSWHTYKASPVFARRELDPKTIRERATEEGRRGEEALRRLVSRRPPEKHKGKEPQQPSQPSQPPASPVAGRTVTQREERRPEKQRTHDLWMETMNAVVREFPAQPGSREATPNPGAAATAAAETPQELFLSGHVPPPVNWDRVHWRKPPKAVSSQSRAQDVVMGNG